MINEHILLEKGKFTGFIGRTYSVWKMMALASVFCLVIALLNGCSDPNLDDPKVREKVLAEAIDEDNLLSRRAPSGEELPYAPNQEQPYTGWVKQYRSLQQFQRGKRHGTYVSWYSNQQKSEKGTFANGQRNGLWTEWYKNGQKNEEGSYKDNSRDGAWVFWYENGQKSSEGIYTSGYKNGLWVEWYTDGTEKSKGAYKEGGKDGAWVFWYENGQKSSEGAYISGSKDSLWTEWYDNGTQKSKGNYKDDFHFGVWTWWHDNGNKGAEGTFKEGKDWSYIYFRDNEDFGFWVKGIADGQWTFWYANGRKFTEGNYKNGNGVGRWTFWYYSGQKYCEGTFRSSTYRIPYVTVFGEGYEYDDTDWETFFTVAGIFDGQWTFWHANGRKWIELTVTWNNNNKWTFYFDWWDWDGRVLRKIVDTIKVSVLNRAAHLKQ